MLPLYTTIILSLSVYTQRAEGFRTSLFRTVPLWYADYFELKTVKSQQTQEELYLLLNCLTNLDKEPVPGRALSLEIITYPAKCGGLVGSSAGLVFSKYSLHLIVSVEYGKHLFTKCEQK